MKIYSTVWVSSALLLLGCTPDTIFEKIIPPAPIALNETTQSLKTLKPALAVRATSCLMCHASVQANMITDFGFGDSYFLDQGANSTSGGSYYFNHGLDSWQGATLGGNLIVPKVQLERPNLASQLNTVDSMVASLGLADFVQSPVKNDMKGTPFSPPRKSMVASSVSVVEKSNIYIGAPTTAEIMSLAPAGFGASGPALQAVGPNSKVSGLTVSADGKFITNMGTIECEGDIVVKGPLFLDTPSINTLKGCRLYVAGTAFLNGKLDFINGNELANLQISASKAIGLGFNAQTLSRRLCLPNTLAAWTLPYAFTRGPGTNQEKRQSIVDDATQVTGLRDADQEATMPTYSRLLLNAPEVHSRYSTHFTGAVIAEIALFRIGQFNFAFDSVFEKVDVLRALPRDVLVVQD